MIWAALQPNTFMTWLAIAMRQKLWSIIQDISRNKVPIKSEQKFFMLLFILDLNSEWNGIKQQDQIITCIDKQLWWRMSSTDCNVNVVY